MKNYRLPKTIKAYQDTYKLNYKYFSNNLI